MVPPPESVNFKEYGLKHIETLANHFYNTSNVSCEVKKQQLQAEWGKFKFDLLEWKKVIPKDVVDGKCPTMTTTTWTLHHMLKQLSYRHFYPLLSNLAECCLSIPISNAWPERGASALKRIKARLRSRLQNDMLQANRGHLDLPGQELHTPPGGRKDGNKCRGHPHKHLATVFLSADCGHCALQSYSLYQDHVVDAAAYTLRRLHSHHLYQNELLKVVHILQWP